MSYIVLLVEIFKVILREKRLGISKNKSIIVVHFMNYQIKFFQWSKNSILLLFIYYYIHGILYIKIIYHRILNIQF